ncbi:hypothetical protein Y032_0123g1157 [Ancylostoma ceylanicum]|uniref:Uncharacterized protein n=1 Tax=Ancylostoma ceylanicum TaxID=53326 RepID=A0A016T8N7_9BILA|nr:hypothetical protein Y032_0123g1157 [Ancylostoma ceylanicum]
MRTSPTDFLPWVIPVMHPGPGYGYTRRALLPLMGSGLWGAPMRSTTFFRRSSSRAVPFRNSVLPLYV